MPSARAVGSALSIPWTGFVAVFLYYVGLTLVAIGVGELPGLFIAVSYAVPVVAYLAILASRGLSALARLPVELWPTSNLILH